MEDKQENMRRLVEMSLNYGRKKQNAQTGYIHLNYGLAEEDAHYSIPLVENFLFILALFRSRSVENINEAKVMLDNLLHFQNADSNSEMHGNFPIYLHEYPVCKDRFIGTHAVIALTWIHRLFHHILGHELKVRVEKALDNAINHALKITSHERAPPYFLAIKIAAAAKAVGEILHNEELVADGTSRLEALHKSPDLAAWYAPATLSSVLVALNLIYHNISESPWKQLWQHVQDSWHHPTCSYAGPSLKEFQCGHEPQVTAYDLFLGYYTSKFSARALRESPAHLEAVLIAASTDHLSPPLYPQIKEGFYGKAKWLCLQTASKAYCLFENKGLSLNPAQEKGFHTFRLIWGNQARVHTFVCQGKLSHAVSFKAHAEDITLTFDLGPPAADEERENNREITFYVDSDVALDFLADGNKTSTFMHGQQLTLTSADCSLAMKFLLKSGDGTFMGHRMLGNRPAQLNNKGSRRYDAYDWLYFFRTVRRSTDCSIQCEISFQ